MIAFDALLKKLDAQQNALLAPFSTLKIGGKARYLVFVKSEVELCEIQKACLEYQQSLHVVSGGSNTLFSDQGFDGVVIKLGPAFDHIEVDPNGVHLSVKAASSFAKVTKIALSLGWSHAVGWSGTPGLIGGAIRMNAGTRLGEIKDALLRVYGVQHGKTLVYEHRDIVFGYRHNNLPSDLIITKADFAYSHDQKKPALELLQHVHDYRLKRKASQPTTASAGSFFKNPYPLFAAQLIENCNIKGLSFKNAQISPLHANFIINNGGALAKDILCVAGAAQRAVFEKFGVMLKPEIRFVGAFDKDSPLLFD